MGGTSRDDGRHWIAGRRVLDASPAMYSLMAALPDGHFGTLWEDGSGNLDYARFDLAWLAGR